MSAGWVAIVTMQAHPVPGVAELAWAEDLLIIKALEARGIQARSVAWTAGEHAFDGAALVVVRTPWDYKERIDEFLLWTRRVGERAPTWNPPDLLRWNARKSYLADLQRRGVPTVPGRLVGQGERFDVAAAIAEHGDVVIKPILDAGGREAMRAGAGMEAVAQAHLDRLLRRGATFVQPFLRSISTDGERSLVFIRGEFSHAVRKVPASTDFRTHGIHGGTAQPAKAAAPDLALARAALDATPLPTLQARVDVVTANDGRPVVIELELLEPYLFLSDAPGSADRYAAAVEPLLDSA